jgi:hypothetical protein
MYYTITKCKYNEAYPPHLSPRAMRADFRRSSPREASSSQEEKAERSKCAPTCVSALPVSFYNIDMISIVK